MGSRNADRIPLSHRRARCQGVGEMIAQGWDVRATCWTCRTTLAVDLARVARAKGAAFSLWDKPQRCRKAGCAGTMELMARAPGMSVHEPLRAEPEAPAAPPAWLRARGLA